jgi:AAA domain
MTTTTLMPGKVGGLKTRKAADDRSLPSVVIYGGSGTGKTTLAASACEVEDMSPILILNIENGTQSIRDIYPDVDVVDIEAFGELQGAYDYLYDNSDHQSQTCAGYKTVILDNLTETQKKGMEHIFRDDNLRKGGGISFTEFVTATYKNGGWNDSSEQMRKLIRAFRGLPSYVIFCAWELDFSKSEGAHLWTPAFTRTLAGEAPGLVNDVYRLHFTQGGERALQTCRTRNTVAKDRTRRLPALLENPTMPLIHAYWTGALVKPLQEESPGFKSNLKMRKP